MIRSKGTNQFQITAYQIKAKKYLKKHRKSIAPNYVKSYLVSNKNYQGFKAAGKYKS